jgi:quercetin dioxygenase-like cupin family protein
MKERTGDDARRHSPRRLVGGEETGGRFALLEIVESRGGGPPRHLHHWEDEVIYVLAGELAIQRGGERLDGGEGTAILLPRGTEHAWRVESEAARLLVVVAPAGLEASWAELSSRETPLERLVAVAAHRGIEITGPPLDR